MFIGEYMSTSRIAQAPVDSQFLQRWSGRVFSSAPLSEEQIKSLFEAARWAPSCFNEQPWLFVYASNGQDLSRLRPLLVEKNRLWTDRVPLLVVVLARRHFAHNGKPNRHAAFDAGASWMSLALQAHKMGLMAHAMAGFDERNTYKVLNVSPERYEAMAMVAIGKYGNPTTLPAELLAAEKPSARKDGARVAVPLSDLPALLLAGETP